MNKINDYGEKLDVDNGIKKTRLNCTNAVIAVHVYCEGRAA